MRLIPTASTSWRTVISSSRSVLVRSASRPRPTRRGSRRCVNGAPRRDEVEPVGDHLGAAGSPRPTRTGGSGRSRAPRHRHVDVRSTSRRTTPGSRSGTRCRRSRRPGRRCAPARHRPCAACGGDGAGDAPADDHDVDVVGDRLPVLARGERVLPDRRSARPARAPGSRHDRGRAACPARPGTWRAPPGSVLHGPTVTHLGPPRTRSVLGASRSWHACQVLRSVPERAEVGHRDVPPGDPSPAGVRTEIVVVEAARFGPPPVGSP